MISIKKIKKKKKKKKKKKIIIIIILLNYSIILNNNNKKKKIGKDSENSSSTQTTQKPRRTNLLEEQRKQLIIQIEQKNKKLNGNYDDNLPPMSAYPTYNSHSPLKQRMSISASSNAGNNSYVNNEEAETLEEEEIWPIMEGNNKFKK